MALGVGFNAAAYAMSRGRRDFTSVTQTIATKYEVLCEHKVAAQAREMLQAMPGARAAHLNRGVARARALCLIARSARCDVRRSPPSSSDLVKRPKLKAHPSRTRFTISSCRSAARTSRADSFVALRKTLCSSSSPLLTSALRARAG